MDLQNEAIELQKVFHQDYKTYWEETEAIKAHLKARFRALGLGAVMPRISHFVSEIGQEYQADDEAVLFEIQDGNLRFYEIGYDFERIYLTPVYVA